MLRRLWQSGAFVLGLALFFGDGRSSAWAQLAPPGMGRPGGGGNGAGLPPVGAWQPIATNPRLAPGTFSGTGPLNLQFGPGIQGVWARLPDNMSPDSIFGMMSAMMSGRTPMPRAGDTWGPRDFAAFGTSAGSGGGLGVGGTGFAPPAPNGFPNFAAPMNGNGFGFGGNAGGGGGFGFGGVGMGVVPPRRGGAPNAIPNFAGANINAGGLAGGFGAMPPIPVGGFAWPGLQP